MITPAGDDIIIFDDMRPETNMNTGKKGPKTTAKRPEISISTLKILYVEIILMCVPMTRTND
jgi:hypothetical protein